MNSVYCVRRIIVLMLCAGLLLSVKPTEMEARKKKNKSQLTVSIGQPNVWSLAQAHYLLANMRQNNRAAKVDIRNDVLDPTVANGTRVDVLRTLLGAEVQHSGVAGVQNRTTLQKFEAEFARRQAIQTSLDQATQQFIAVSKEISELKAKLATLPESSPEAKELNTVITQKNAEKQAMDEQIKALTPQLATAPTLGQLNSTAPFPNAPPGISALPDDLKTIFDKTLATATPKLNASTALDSYIQIQYELIAKQLTLLRDEVGPKQRLIFLELPSDLYSVPDKDDHYLVQMEWKTEKYFGDKEQSETGEIGKSRQQFSQFYPVTLEIIDRYNQLKAGLTPNELSLVKRILSENIKSTDADAPKIEAYAAYQELKDLGYFESAEKRRKIGESRQEATDEWQQLQKTADDINALTEVERKRIQRLSEFKEFNELYPSLWGKDYVDISKLQDASSKVRVVDIIPRQSALNVTDAHAKQEGFAFTARFLSFFGLGGQVSYQRQRTLYEQFLQQDVYASGFGKGLSSFGWTLGPLPGTERLAPGVRTMHAILAIPKDALEVDLLVSAKVYHREDSPDGSDEIVRKPVKDQRIRILIPSESTQGFWLDEAIYTPVNKGERVTVMLRGKYFSSLTGVLVEGVPLKRAVSIAKNESDSTSLTNAVDAFGEYEYLNPNELILSFKMPDQNFTGTPLITLITPEKTATINYYRLNINYHRDKSSLLSEKEPMFLDKLQIDAVRVSDFPTNPGGMIRARLLGRGFRLPAEIFIDDQPKPLSKKKENKEAEFLNTEEYDLKFKPENPKKWKVTYRYAGQVASKEFKVESPTIDSLANLQTGKAEGSVDGETVKGEKDVVIIRGHNLADVTKVTFGNKEAKIEDSRGDLVLFVKVPPGAAEGKVRVTLLDKWKEQNLADFATPGKAIYEYTANTKPTISLLPSITSIENPTTGKAEGSTAGGETVTIRGVNLAEAETVLFGRRRAIIEKRDSHVLLVQVPPGEGGVQVFIELRTPPPQPAETYQRNRTRLRRPVASSQSVLTNIHDFETPGKAIYKYVQPVPQPKSGETVPRQQD